MLGISPNIFCAKRHWIFLVRFPLILVNNGGGQRWVFRGLPKSSYPVVFTGLDDRSCVRIESADRKCVDSRSLNSFRHWLEIAAHHEKTFGERENFVSPKSHRKFKNLKSSDFDKHPNFANPLDFRVQIFLFSKSPKFWDKNSSWQSLEPFREAFRFQTFIQAPSLPPPFIFRLRRGNARVSWSKTVNSQSQNW